MILHTLYISVYINHHNQYHLFKLLAKNINNIHLNATPHHSGPKFCPTHLLPPLFLVTSLH